MVLSRQPVQVIQIREIEEVVEGAGPVAASSDLVQDFTEAPEQRQSEIFQRLAFWSMDQSRPELVRSNCYRLLRQFEPLAPNPAKIGLAQQLEQRIGRRAADLETAQVAIASGSFPFIHLRQQRLITSALIARFDAVKPHWSQHPHHGELLDDFQRAGGFAICPTGVDRRVARWFVEAYIGEPGRYGTWGRNRAVFYSDTAAPRIEKILDETNPSLAGNHFEYIANEEATRRLLQVPEQETRLRRLMELATSPLN